MWSSERGRRAAVFLAAIALEALPFEAALLLVNALDQHVVGLIAVPFWYVVVTLAAAAWLGARAGGRSDNRLLISGVPGIAVGFALLALTSPAAFGATSGFPADLGHLGTIAQGEPGIVARLVALFVAVLYLWYRGLLLGSRPPGLTTVQRRLRVGLAVIIACGILLLGVPVALRAAVAGLLTLALLAEAFFGLVASALVRPAIHDDAAAGAVAADRQPWTAFAVFLGWVVVALALLLGLLVNSDQLDAALRNLGPVGAAADVAIRWLTDGLAHLLGLIFGGGLHPLQPAAKPGVTVPPRPICPPENPTCPHQQAAAPAAFWVGTAGAIVAVMFVALLTYVGYLLLRSAMLRSRPAFAVTEEVRESLGGRSMLRQQLRGLLRARGRDQVDEAEEDLPRGGVRALYRDLLRAAAGAGVGRRPAETPNEFAARLLDAAPFAHRDGRAEGDLRDLSAAYSRARYAARDGDLEATPSLRDRARRLIGDLPRRRG